jgi:hypothetical protein
MDKFWADEEDRLSQLAKALKNRRLVPKDIDHWGGFQENWKKINTNYEVWLSSHVGRHSSAFILLQKTVNLVASKYEYDLGSDEFDAAFVVHKKRGGRSSFANATSLLEAEQEFTTNRKYRSKIFDGCNEYVGKRENMITTLDASYSPFSQSRDSEDFLGRARLREEGKEVASYAAIQGTPVQFAIHFC